MSTIQPTNESIKDLENDIELYTTNIENDPKDANSYYMKAEALVRLSRYKKDKLDFNEALDCYTKAIELSDDANPLYLIDRSRLYVNMGKTDLAIQDIEKVSKLSADNSIISIYLENTMRDITRLDTVQATITQLVTNGKIDNELAAALREHANVTANLVVQVGIHSDRLDEHDDRVERLEMLVGELQKDKLSQQQIMSFKKEIQTETTALRKKIDDNKKDLNSLYDEARIKADIIRLTQTEPEHKYFHTFYWTVVNLLGAYRSLSTGLVQGKPDESTKEKLIWAGAKWGTKKAAAVFAELAKGIPFVGGIVGALDEIFEGIKEIRDMFKEKKFENKVNIINKIIQTKFATEDDISIGVAKWAIIITTARKEKNEILPSAVKTLFDNKLASKSKLNVIEQGVEKFLTKVNLNVVDLHDKNNRVIQLALQDVVSLMAYLLINYQDIIKYKSSLNEEWFTDVLPKLNKVLEKK